MEQAFFKLIDKRPGDCVGVMKCAPVPFQEFFFIDTEPYEELDEDLKTTVKVKPVDFLQLEQVESTREECETLLAMYAEAGEVYLR